MSRVADNSRQDRDGESLAGEVRGVLFDLDGVLYVGDKPIAGGNETLDYCREHELPVRFITNTSTRSVSDVANKLHRLGLSIEEREIFSAVSATRQFLERQGKPAVHLLIREAARGEFADFEQDTDTPDYVVVGDIGAAWDYELLNRVFRELMDGAELVAMHMNKYFETEQGLQMDIGAFVAGLEFVSGKQAQVIGKPSESFFSLALESLGVAAEEAIIVGDDVENDIGGGQASGLRGVLVRTGKYREELLRHSDVTPDAIIDSVADLPALLAAAD